MLKSRGKRMGKELADLSGTEEAGFPAAERGHFVRHS